MPQDFPAYWAALSIAVISIWLTGDRSLLSPLGIVTNLTLLPQFLPALGNLSWISITWAVLVEFQFYLVAATVVTLASVTGLRKSVLTAAIVGGLVVYLLVMMTGAQQRFYGAFQFAPFFVTGVALYLTVSRANVANQLLLAIASVLSVHAYLAYVGRGVANLTASCALGAVSMFLAAAPSLLERAKSLDRRMGDLSYPVCLVHMPIIAIAQNWQLGFVSICLATAALAVAIHTVAERPVHRIRRLVRGRSL